MFALLLNNDKLYLLGGSMSKKLVSILAISIAILSFDIANAQIAPKPGFPQDRYKEFKADKDVKYGILPNGMRYAIQHWPTPKGEISLRMRIAAGSLNEDENQKGLMHFLEHMAFNGSENIKEGEMIPLLQKEGLAFGADTNAHTSFDETVYKLDLPKPEQLGLGIKLMRETAGKLKLDAGAIDRERGVIEGEERARMSPGYKQWVDYANTFYDGLRFPKRVPIGDMKVVKTAPKAEFDELYYGLYRPERTFMVIVGDIDVAKAEAELKKQFSDWKGKGKPANDPNLGKLLSTSGKFKNYVDTQIPASISLTSFSPYVPEKDTSMERRNDLLLSIANSILNERYQKMARKEDASFTSSGAWTYDWFNQINAANIDIAPKDETKWKKALEDADLELRSVLQYGFTKAEFDAAIANLRQSYERAVKEDGARRSRAIANSILASFEGDVVHTSSKDDLAWFNKIAPSLNAKDALKLFQNAWGNKNHNLYVVSQTPIDGGVNTLKTALADARKIAAKAPEVEKVLKWDYVDFGKAGVVKTTNYNKELDTNYITFSNNVKLVFKKTDFEKGRVRTAVRFGEGKLSMPKDKIALEWASGASFDAGGLGRLDIDQLQKTLAGKTVGTGFNVGYDAFEFNSVTNDQDLGLQMQIFAAYMTDPAWRKDGFNQLKAAKESIYKDERSTPDTVFDRKYLPILTNNDKSKSFPTSVEFDALNFEDGKIVVENARKDSAIEIVIIGDTSLENAIKAVGSTFGALPERKVSPNPRLEERMLKFTQGRNETKFDHDGRHDQAIGSIFWPARDFGDGTEGRALNILRDMLDVKLTDIIREKEGGTYSPQVTGDFSTTNKGFGYMGVILNVKPAEVDKYLKITEEIAKEFAEGKIDEDLLKRAKTPAIAAFEVSINNNPWWLTWLKGSSFDESRIAIIRDGKKQYERVTLDEVKSLAKQYFDPSKAQIIKVLPSEKSKAAN